MDVRDQGYGWIVPRPNPQMECSTQLGNVIRVHKEGYLELLGNIYEDRYFQEMTKVLNRHAAFHPILEWQDTLKTVIFANNSNVSVERYPRVTEDEKNEK